MWVIPCPVVAAHLSVVEEYRYLRSKTTVLGSNGGTCTDWFRLKCEQDVHDFLPSRVLVVEDRRDERICALLIVKRRRCSYSLAVF